MRITALVRLFAALFMFACVQPATAATLIVGSNGQLTGATGVDVHGTLYDVTFVDGTCAAIYNGCDQVSDFTFTNATTALQATTALLGQVFTGTYDANPALTAGCGDPLACVALVPYVNVVDLGGLSVFGSGAFNSTVEAADTPQWGFMYPVTYDMGNDATQTWAVFTLSQTAPSGSSVPEPSTWAMMLLGFGGIGAVMRRRKRSPTSRSRRQRS